MTALRPTAPVSAARRPLLAAVVALAALLPGARPARADLRISDVSFASGVLFPDTDVSGRGDGANDFVAAQALRASVPIGKRWSFFGEAEHAGIPSSRRFGDADLFSLRGGFRRWAGGPGRSRFFLDGGLGWTRIALHNRALAVDRPVLAVGLGELFPIGDRAAFHWELRTDLMEKDGGDPIGGAIRQPAILVGITLRFPEPRDRDGDGVADDRDACPGTPAGALVDAAGCPLDEDLDGVADGLDLCPGTPRGAPVDATGCSIVSDSDDDGVPDGLDQCPDTPAHVLVDAQGCPRTARFEVAQPVVLKGVGFDTASARLTEDARAVLDRVAESLAGRIEVRVEVGGHADVREADESDLALRRAESVRAYLIAHGVPEQVLVARGYGAEAPVADSGTTAGRAANRRVELKRLNDSPGE